MKNTIVIEVTNQKALGLLHELEELELIRIVKGSVVPESRPILSEKFRGMINRDQGDELNKDIHQMRKEWSDL